MSKSPVSLQPRDYQPSSSSSSSQPRNDHDVPPTPSSAIKATRRNSLRLSLQPPSVPIPPSLLQSPYLNAHKAPKEQATSHVPSEEEDSWLQDQVPLSATSRARPHSVPPAHPRRAMSNIMYQSPPLTPPVRPSSVLIAGLGDWRVPPPIQDYPFPSPSTQWRKSPNFASQRRSDVHSQRPPPTSPGYFSDLSSMH